MKGKMKNKRVAWLAGGIVTLCTVLLMVTVFLAQEAKAQQSLAIAIENQQETPTDAVNPLPIGTTPLPQGELKMEEIVFGNWIISKPGAADMSEEQAVGNAVLVAEALFDLKNPVLEDATFRKDMTGQRGNYWVIKFEDDELCMCVDALTGNIYYCCSNRFELGQAFDSPGEHDASMELIWQNWENGKSEYYDTVKAIVNSYLPNGVEKIDLNAVHGATHGDTWSLAVSVFVEMQDGTIYDMEFIKEASNGDIMLDCMYVYPDRDHMRYDSLWHADMLYDQMESEQ